MLKMFEFGPFPDEEKAQIIKEKAIHIERTIFEHRIVKNGQEEFHNYWYH